MYICLYVYLSIMPNNLNISGHSKVLNRLRFNEQRAVLYVCVNVCVSVCLRVAHANEVILRLFVAVAALSVSERTVRSTDAAEAGSGPLCNRMRMFSL